MSDENDRLPKTRYSEYTIEEIMAIEYDKYVIQVGSDLLTNEKGKMAFSKQRTEELYENLLTSLNEMKISKDPLERQDALACLKHLHIYPLRIH